MSDFYSIAVYEAEEDEGGFWCEVLNLPGCVAQGETLDELRRNLRDAISAWEDTEREDTGSLSGWRSCETWNIAVDDVRGLIGTGPPSK